MTQPARYPPELRELEQESRELRRANEILKSRIGFLGAGARSARASAMRFITEHKGRWGVEPICRVLQVAPSSYYAASHRPPSARQQQDEALQAVIRRVWNEHGQVYGADRVWAQLKLEGIPAARCTVERLMRKLGLQGRGSRQN
jgi:putative transposase